MRFAIYDYVTWESCSRGELQESSNFLRQYIDALHVVCFAPRDERPLRHFGERNNEHTHRFSRSSSRLAFNWGRRPQLSLLPKGFRTL